MPCCLMLNRFLTKTVIQEENVGVFICPKCPYYSTMDSDQFMEHLNQNHFEINLIMCIYCDQIFSKDVIIKHIEYHFRNNISGSMKCKKCSENISLKSLESVLQHFKSNHSNTFICVNCNRDCNNSDGLKKHLTSNYTQFYHCTFQKCKVKSNDYEEIVDHKNLSGHNEVLIERMLSCCLTDICANIDRSNLYSRLDINYIGNKRKSVKESEAVFKSFKPEKRRKMNYEKPNIKDVDEVYSLKFLKSQFLIGNQSITSNEELIEKLSKVSTIQIGRSRSGDIRNYHCMCCGYISEHSYNDVKKHILAMHCHIHYSFIGNNLPYISHELITKKEVTLYEMKMPYSFNAFEVFYKDRNNSEKENLKKKLEFLKQFTIKVDLNHKPKVFYCCLCDFTSSHSYVDVKRHIMRIHCQIDDTYISDCCKLTKLDLEWNLLPDDDIINLFSQKNSKDSGKSAPVRVRSSKKFVDPELVALQRIKNRRRSQLDTNVLENSFIEKEISMGFSEYLLINMCKTYDLENSLIKYWKEINEFCKYKIIVCQNNNKRKYVCSIKDYSSAENIEDVQDHIIKTHMKLPSDLSDLLSKSSTLLQ